MNTSLLLEHDRRILCPSANWPVHEQLREDQTEPDEESDHHDVADDHDGTASNDPTMCSQPPTESFSEAFWAGSRTLEGLVT